MEFELDGMMFNVEITISGDNMHILNLFTNTPCCLDVCYCANISKASAKHIAKAINNRLCNFEIADNYTRVELKYWTREGEYNIILIPDIHEYEVGESIKKIKSYFALVRELKTTKARLVDAYKLSKYAKLN